MEVIPENSQTATRKAYASQCDVIHMDVHTPMSAFNNLAPNSIISSYFTTFEAELFPAQALGVKYVSEGKETYWVKGRKCEVTPGKYLLVNEAEPQLDVCIKNNGALGMCVNIDAAVLNDLLLQVLRPNNLEAMGNVERYFLSPELLVRQTHASTALQQFMDRLITYVGRHHENPPMEFIYELASMVVLENLDLIQSYYKLNATKRSTRKELFRRLLLGKEVLNESIFEEVSIGQVAEQCCLSEFRFYRLFRQCFGISPYQYLFRKRIEKSLELKEQNISWGDIAYQLNFTDLAAFSKGFKKVTGVSPTQYAY